MGTCISRPKRRNKDRSQGQLYLQQPQASIVQNLSQNMDPSVPPNKLLLAYPYFQPGWTVSKNQTILATVNIYQMLIKAANSKVHSAADTNLNWRYYSYSDIENKKIFSSQHQNAQKNYKKAFQWNSKLCMKVPLLESLIFSPANASRVKICPEYEYVILPPDSVQEHSEDTIQTNSFHLNVYHMYQNHLKQIVVDLLSSDDKINSLIKTLRSFKKTSLGKNCLFNGMLFQKQELNQQPNGSRNRLVDVLEIFNQRVEKLGSNDQIICYINPLVNDTVMQKARNYSKIRCSTYLQLKCQLERQKLQIVDLFNPEHILISAKCEPFCIYILLFCVKVLMYNFNSNYANEQIPMTFLNQFIKMNPNQNKLLYKITNIMMFCYSIGVSHSADNFKKHGTEIIKNCCRNILQIASVNSHIMLDAYLVQFSIQIDEKASQIRQNPLTILKQPLKYRILIVEQPNCRMIADLKGLMDKKLQQISQSLSSKTNLTVIKQNSNNLGYKNQNQLVFKWREQCQAIILSYFNGKDDRKVQNIQKLKNAFDLNKENYGMNVAILFQYLLSIKIFSFVIESQQIVDLFVIAHSEVINNIQAIRKVKKMWEQIIQEFMNSSSFTYCSGQLAITILTLDSLVKLLQQNNNSEQPEQSLKKCVEIWFRIYRDPRSKYRPFLSNQWVVYLINFLIKIKRKNLSDSHSSESIFYFQNILECFYSNGQVSQFGSPTYMEWILLNLPIRGISGIFYNKLDLLAPTVVDQKSIFFMRTGSSLIETPNDLSSKSNYSQSLSNNNSTYSKTNKKSKKRNVEITQFSEARTKRSGVYIWGKGVNCLPLIYPLSKNLDVFKISCGSFHVIIATPIGIFGWGENSSGQLGHSQSKQPVWSIKMITPMVIQSQAKISLSCGNEHTAILPLNQNLIMLGQVQGGIISGNGHKFDSVTCGGLHTLGIINGRVYSWGRGEGGQLGHKPQFLKTKVKEESTDFYLDSPKMIQNLPFITKSVCGDAHSVLLTKQGDVYVFGFSYQGQLGLGLTGESQIFQIFQPVKVQFSTKLKTTKIADIFAGSTFTFFKTCEGQILSCGLNDCNQLGVQKMMKVFQKKKYLGQEKKMNEKKLGEIQFSKPNRIQFFNSQIKVKQIYCGQNHCLASVQYIKKNKMIMGWGLNKQLQISSEFSHENITPRTIDNIYDYNFSQICCGSNFSMGLIPNEKSTTLKNLQQNIQLIIRNSVTFCKPQALPVRQQIKK